jgi:hypothetical protein
MENRITSPSSSASDLQAKYNAISGFDVILVIMLSSYEKLNVEAFIFLGGDKSIRYTETS